MIEEKRMGKLKAARKAAFAAIAVLLLLLATTLLPTGSDNKAKTGGDMLMLKLSELNTLPQAVNEKISPVLMEKVKEAVYRKETGGKGDDRIEFIVKSKKGIKEEISKAGGKILNAVDSIDGMSKYFAVEAEAEKVAQLASGQEVIRVLPRTMFHVMLEQSVPMVKADAFWKGGNTGVGVKVAVIDTGMDASHPMLKGRVVAEKDFVDGDAIAQDDNGHGTHVAGIIAGSKAGGGLMDGVAPGAELINAKAMDENGAGPIDRVFDAINWALDPDSNPATNDGARIISMSLGTTDPLDAEYENDLKAAVSKGAIIVVAAGNCGPGCTGAICPGCGGFKGVTAPGSSPSVITVGAIDKSKNVAYFSGGGVYPEIGVKPDFVAPGVSIKSSVPGGYSLKDGTSMAAPHVSGAIALMLNRTPTLKQDDVKRILEKTSEDLGEPGKDASYGFGLIDLAKAAIYREGVEFKVEMAPKLISQEVQKIAVTVYDDVKINSVKATITKPNGEKSAFDIPSTGSGDYAYDYTDTAILGKYALEVTLNYGGSSNASKDSGSTDESGGSGSSGGSGGAEASIDLFHLASFKVISPLGEIGMIDEINVSSEQRLSSNLTGNITFTAVKAEETRSLSLQLADDAGKIAYETTQPIVEQGLAILVVETQKLEARLNLMVDVKPGNYTLRIAADLGTGSVVNETNLTLIDDKPPIIEKVDYSNVTGDSPLQFLLKVSEHSTINTTLTVNGSYTCSDACPDMVAPPFQNDISHNAILTGTAGSPMEVSVTAYETFPKDYYNNISARIKLCDSSGNCALTEWLPFSMLSPAKCYGGEYPWQNFAVTAENEKNLTGCVAECNTKRLLVARAEENLTGFDRAAAEAGGICYTSISRPVAGTPPPSYLDRFDAVIWSTSATAQGIDESGKASLTRYNERSGRLLVEGSDVAFRNENNRFLWEVLHAALAKELSAKAAAAKGGPESVWISATIPHPLLAGIKSPILFNSTNDPFPDAVMPYNGGAEVARFKGLEENSSAIIVYESSTARTGFLPFSMEALETEAAGTLASNFLKWLLDDSIDDITPKGVYYANPVPEPPPDKCVAVCIGMWEIIKGSCNFNECGSGCGPNGYTTFGSKAECEISVKFGGIGIPVEGQSFGIAALIANTREFPSPPQAEVFIDGTKIETTSKIVSKDKVAFLGTAKMSAGRYPVRVMANSNFALGEANYVNNAGEYNLTVYPAQPDLRVSGISYSYDDSTSSAAINLTAANMGGNPATATIRATMTLEGAAEETAAEQEATFAAGEEKQLTFLIKAKKATYNVKVEADPGNTVAEYNESNNIVESAIYLCNREKVMVIDDNTAEMSSTPEPSSADEFMDTIRKGGYCVEGWNKKENGEPAAAAMAPYDVIVWSAGDYFNGTLTSKDKEELLAYTGAILLEGSDISLDSSGDDNFSMIAGAEFGGDLLLNDTEKPEELVLKEHPITAGIAGISISTEKSPYPDRAEQSTGHTVAEWEDGSQAIVGNNQTGERKTAYYAFSVDGVSDPAAMEKLILNTIGWLLTKQNSEPELHNITNITAAEGENVTLFANATDADGDAISYSVNDSRFKQKGLTGEFEWQTGYADSGMYEIVAQAGDGKSATTAMINVTILETNRPPVIDVSEEGVSITATPKIFMKEGQEKNLSAFAIDPDGDPLTYTWLLNGTVISDTQKVTLRFRYNESGSYNLTVIASDGQSSDNNEFLLIVLDTMECDPGAQTRLCGNQQGVCGGSEETCNNTGKWAGCTTTDYASYSPEYETEETMCDGLDNDCNGEVDDGFDDVDDDGIANCVDKDNDNDGSDDSEDDIVGNETDITIKGGDGKAEIEVPEPGKGKGKKKITITSGGKRLIEFTRNFSKGNITIMNLTIEKQDDASQAGFIRISGLDLRGGQKTAYIDRIIPGSNTVCVKDVEIAKISEVSNGCTDESEKRVECKPGEGKPATSELCLPEDGGEDAPNCGGFAELKCPDDFTCSYTKGSALPTYPGEQGTCVASDCEPLSCTLDAALGQYAVSGLYHSGVLEQCFDSDGDSYLPTGCEGGLDCNDTDGSISPAGTETCNDLDDDCDGSVDEDRVCNTPPKLNPVGNRTAAENEQLAFSLSAEDTEADALMFNATSLPQGAHFDNETATLEWTPNFEHAGTHSAKFRASDGLLDDFEEINVTVANTNRIPVIEAVDGNFTVNESEKVNLAITASDPDGDGITYSVNDTRLAQDIENPEMFSWQTGYEDSGSYVVAVNASDGGLSAYAEITVTVNNVNRAPVMGALEGKTKINENDTAEIIATATDPDGDAIDFSINDSRFTMEKITLDIWSARYVWKTGYEDSGTYIVEVTASDSFLNDTATTTLTVAHVNRKPWITKLTGNLTVNETEKATIEIFATDEDGDALTYALNDTRLEPLGNGMFEWATSYDDAGEYEVMATVSDGGLSDSTEAKVTVLNVNREPSIEPIGNRTVKENETIEFEVKASDPDKEDTVSVAATIPASAQGAEYDGHAFAWTTDFEQEGVYEIVFTAGDGAAFVHEHVNITVENVNRKPEIIKADNVEVNEVEEAMIIVTASDADQDSISYSVNDSRFTAEISDGVTISSAVSTERFTWQTGYDDAGDYVVEVKVTDDLAETTANITVAVKNVNRNPHIEPVENSSVKENQTIKIQAQAADPDKEDEVSYKIQAQETATGVEFDGTTGKLEWTPTFEQADEYEFTITATDGELSDSTHFNITVLHVNRAPEIDGMENSLTVNETELIFLEVKAHDPDGDDVSYAINDSRFKEQDFPNAFEWETGYDDAGTYELIASVSDGELAATRNAKITVLNVNRPPVIEPIGNKTVKENETLEFEVDMTDPDKGTLLAGSIESPAAAYGLEFDGVFFRWTPDFEQEGAYEIKFTVTDSDLSSSELINITVENTNRVPEIAEADKNVIVNETEAAVIIVTAADADGDAMNISVNDSRFISAKSSGSSGGSGEITSLSVKETESFTWHTGYEDAGTYKVRITANDSVDHAEADATVVVRNVNRPPAIEPMLNITARENETFTAQAKAADPDKEDALSYLMTSEKDAAGTLFDHETGTLEWTPGFEQAGTYSFTATATDGDMNDSARFNVTVLNTNRPPKITMVLIEPPSLEMGEGEDKTFIAGVSDDDDDDIKVMWKLDGSPAGTGDTYTFEPLYNDSGAHTLELVINDSNDTSSMTMTVTVQDTLECGEGQTQLCPLQLGVCAGSFVPCDQGHWPACIYYQSHAAGKGQAYAPVEAFCPGQNNDNLCKALCDGLDNDCDGFKDEERVCNTPPVIHTGDATVNEGSVLQMPIGAYDAELDHLVFSASELPHGASINSNPGTSATTLVWMPGFDDAGIYSTIITASDGLQEGTKRISITVLNTNRAPLAAIKANPEGTIMNEGETKTLEADASDPDGNELEYVWLYNGEKAADTPTYRYTPNWTDGDESSASEFVLRVSDRELSATASVSIIINDTQKCLPQSAESEKCGSSTGKCEQGTRTRTCSSGYLWSEWTDCIGEVRPEPEEDCSTWDDDNCNGRRNEGCLGRIMPTPPFR